MAGAILKAEKAKPAPAASAGRDAATAHKIDFKRDIAPIFEASCVACHGAEKPLGQLRLDSETALLRGGISGKVIVAGKGGESLLVRRLLGQGGAPRMPMGPDALPKAKLELIRAWIDQGLSTAEASSASLAADDSATSAGRDAYGTSGVRPICHQDSAHSCGALLPVSRARGSTERPAR